MNQLGSLMVKLAIAGVGAALPKAPVAAVGRAVGGAVKPPPLPTPTARPQLGVVQGGRAAVPPPPPAAAMQPRPAAPAPTPAPAGGGIQADIARARQNAVGAVPSPNSSGQAAGMTYNQANVSPQLKQRLAAQRDRAASMAEIGIHPAQPSIPGKSVGGGMYQHGWGLSSSPLGKKKQAMLACFAYLEKWAALGATRDVLLNVARHAVTGGIPNAALAAAFAPEGSRGKAALVGGGAGAAAGVLGGHLGARLRRHNRAIAELQKTHVPEALLRRPDKGTKALIRTTRKSLPIYE